MSYCTLADFIRRFSEDEAIQLTDRDNAGAPDASVFALAAADADTEIDGYLSVRYALPLEPLPDSTALEAVSRVAGDIIRLRLHGGDEAPKEWRNRFDDARRWLEQVAAGRINLSLRLRGAAQYAGGAESISPPSVFGDVGGFLGAGW